MASKLYIQPTEFRNVSFSGSSDYESFGFRIYDDFQSYYCNSQTRDDLNLSPAQYLAMVKQFLLEADSDSTRDLLEAIKDYLSEDGGLYIDGTFYTTEELQT